ncbi:hypothetical protein HDU82_007675 [Entophlyctis luteolus]|nr:hypothetical protein HDU82_007675 [Entophlyctis luteolus]
MDFAFVSMSSRRWKPNDDDEDDDAGLRRRCLPIDDYVQARDPLPSYGIPTNGLEYLRMVRHEATALPAYHRAEIKSMDAETLPNRPNWLPTDALTSAGTRPEIPSCLKQTREYCAALLTEFRALKLQRDDWAALGTQPQFSLPYANSNVRVWYNFCYPPSVPSMCSTDCEVPRGMNDIEESGLLSNASWLPLFPVVSHIPHATAIHILHLHIKWLAKAQTKPDISAKLTWIISLLLCVDIHALFPDDTAVLRDLVRLIRKLREDWVSEDFSLVDGLPSDFETAGIYSGAQFVIAVISGIFGQHDLA